MHLHIKKPKLKKVHHDMPPVEKEKANSAEDHISHRTKQEQDLIVDEQGRESFPASDPPGNY